MDRQIRAQSQAARGNHYFDIMRTVCFVEVGLLAIIVFGDIANHLIALWALIIGTGIYAVVGGDQALHDIEGLRNSMDEETARSPYGKTALKVNYTRIRILSGLMNGVIALALLVSTLS